MLEPHVSESAGPRLYNHLPKSAFSQMERRTACHFTETNVQKRIKTKTILPSLLSRALLRLSVPKKLIRLRGCAILPLCHITEGNNNNMQQKSKLLHHPLIDFFLFLCSPRCSPVTGSMSPGSASQILARKKRRGVSGLQPRVLIFCFRAVLLSSHCPAARLSLCRS